MDFTLNTNTLFEIGANVSKKLISHGVTTTSVMTIPLGKEEFETLDEDLFLRNKKSDDEEFKPSEGSIELFFEQLVIKIEKNA